MAYTTYEQIDESTVRTTTIAGDNTRPREFYAWIETIYGYDVSYSQSSGLQPAHTSSWEFEWTGLSVGSTYRVTVLYGPDGDDYPGGEVTFTVEPTVSYDGYLYAEVNGMAIDVYAYYYSAETVPRVLALNLYNTDAWTQSYYELAEIPAYATYEVSGSTSPYGELPAGNYLAEVMVIYDNQILASEQFSLYIDNPYADEELATVSIESRSDDSILVKFEANEIRDYDRTMVAGPGILTYSGTLYAGYYTGYVLVENLNAATKYTLNTSLSNPGVSTSLDQLTTRTRDNFSWGEKFKGREFDLTRTQWNNYLDHLYNLLHDWGVSFTKQTVPTSDKTFYAKYMNNVISGLNSYYSGTGLTADKVKGDTIYADEINDLIYWLDY